MGIGWVTVTLRTLDLCAAEKKSGSDFLDPKIVGFWGENLLKPLNFLTAQCILEKTGYSNLSK